MSVYTLFHHLYIMFCQISPLEHIINEFFVLKILS